LSQLLNNPRSNSRELATGRKPGPRLSGAIEAMTKRALTLMVIAAMMPLSLLAEDTKQPSVKNDVLHLATALDHITVLEFGEAVTLAAAGSSAFNIEWRGNKLLIKPVRAGASTDLFVWTASHRFAYELDPPGEAKNMNFAVDNAVPAKPGADAHGDDQIAAVADMALTRAFLGADRIENGYIKNDKGRVIVRIESAFQSATSLYIRYEIQNLTDNPYRVVKPSVYELVPPDNTVALASLRRTQLNAHTAQKLGEVKKIAIVVASTETRVEDVRPGSVTTGVLVLHRQFTTASVLQVVFADAGDHHVSATFVF
jgi:Conjugal transfer protein